MNYREASFGPFGVSLEPQEWEYLQVECEYWKAEWRPKFMGEERLEGWPGAPSLSKFLTEVGADHWELVTATPGFGFLDEDAGSHRLHLIFKRPKDS